jgi:translation initiation factor IF-2
MIPRNPVVTIMGHVDHGKTTLLDKIRKTNVAGGEAGAITQHISGYKIEYKGKKITFVDTPGHEAFTAMRARGSQMADFVILVVSAVEGPKPQTVEVIERCKISKVPVIVALNKIDLPDSDPERVKTEVSKYGLIPEEWGGDVPFIEISAKNSLNIEKILDTILVHSEMSELTGQTECQGQALVIESHLDRNMGVTATVLVVKDKLKVGDIIRSGEYVGKIRKLQDDLCKNIKEDNIGDPVILIGLPEVVNVGEPIIVYPNPKEAQIDAQKELEQRQNRRISTFSTGGDSENQINIVLIADVSGSLEAIKEAIVKIPQEHVKIVIKQEAVGEVSEGQVDYANITKSTILAFHTKVNNKAEPLLKKFQVSIVASDVIYEILEWLQEEILKHIKHETKIMIYGKAKVLALFRSEKPHIQVFGGEVIDGKIFDNKNLRVVREGKDMGMVKIQELQKNKFKATEVNISQQFGVSATGKTKVKIGDILESIEEVIVK